MSGAGPWSQAGGGRGGVQIGRGMGVGMWAIVVLNVLSLNGDVSG